MYVLPIENVFYGLTTAFKIKIEITKNSAQKYRFLKVKYICIFINKQFVFIINNNNPNNTISGRYFFKLVLCKCFSSIND